MGCPFVRVKDFAERLNWIDEDDGDSLYERLDHRKRNHRFPELQMQ